MKTVRFLAVALACAGLVAAQGAPDNDKLLTTFQNPVGNLISVPFQNNINFPIGEFSRIQDVLNIQPVIPITYNMKHGWFLTSSPIITSNWLAPDHNKVLVPFGGGFGKITKVGTQPLIWQLHTYYNAIHPQDVPYPKWQVRLQVALLFPGREVTWGLHWYRSAVIGSIREARHAGKRAAASETTRMAAVLISVTIGSMPLTPKSCVST